MEDHFSTLFTRTHSNRNNIAIFQYKVLKDIIKPSIEKELIVLEVSLIEHVAEHQQVSYAYASPVFRYSFRSPKPLTNGEWKSIEDHNIQIHQQVL